MIIDFHKHSICNLTRWFNAHLNISIQAICPFSLHYKPRHARRIKHVTPSILWSESITKRMPGAFRFQLILELAINAHRSQVERAEDSKHTSDHISKNFVKRLLLSSDLKSIRDHLNFEPLGSKFRN